MSDPATPAPPAPTADRPLLGLTVLVVEDSRFACEAMRLLCLRSGARIRRADCLRSAKRHLQVYRPSVIVIDAGLPDGSGIELIEDMARATPRVGVILGTSGDDGMGRLALAAGADDFIAKPITDLASFQEIVLRHLPAENRPCGPRRLPTETVVPDPLAYCDDMAHIADVMNEGSDDRVLDYLAQFAGGVARSASDGPLAEAASALRAAREAGQPARACLAQLAGLVQERLERREAI